MKYCKAIYCRRLIYRKSYGVSTIMSARISTTAVKTVHVKNRASALLTPPTGRGQRFIHTTVYFVYFVSFTIFIIFYIYSLTFNFNFKKLRFVFTLSIGVGVDVHVFMCSKGCISCFFFYKSFVLIRVTRGLSSGL